MKKLWGICFTIALTLMLTACGVNESEIKSKAKYFTTEAFNAGLVQDWDRINEIAAEEAEYVENLDSDELEIYNKAVLETAEQLMY